MNGNVNLASCSFFIQGSNNRIIIGEGSFLGAASFWIEDDNNVIEIGRKASVNSNCNFTCTEGHRLLIGEGCLFSSNINFQVGDGHGIFDINGNRLNLTEDIIIGDHVWIGKRASVLKGARIPANSVVGTGAIVTKQFTQENVVIAGVPAKVVKENIIWKKDRNG